MDPLLEVRNLTVTFRREGKREFLAADHLNFCLYDGEILGIAGESGSGKSTAARAITRLIDVREGQILLKGRDITHLKGKALREVYREIQMVFQSPVSSFDPRRTLGDGIGESLRNRKIRSGERKRLVGKLLQRCGLSEEYAGRYPYEVSGGECQRAAIARALAPDPGILICDEATSSLDVTVQRQIMELLEDLQKEKGMSCLFICHDLALVQRFCDRVLVMEEGRVVESGTPDDIIRNPKEDYTRRLVDAVL